MLRTMTMIAVSLVWMANAPAERLETGFLDRELVVNDPVLGETVRRYQVFVPRSYQRDRVCPCVLFLHGGGEEGTDGYLQTTAGLGEAIRRYPERFPVIVVFPQVKPDHQWTGGEAAIALATLDQTQREFNIDPDRVTLTGMSRGARGAYYLACRHPARFAAILAVCGRVGPLEPRRSNGTRWKSVSPVVPDVGGDPFDALATRLVDVPTWVVHGAEDRNIPAEESRSLVAAMRARGASIEYSELAGVGHNAWDAAYRSAEIVGWLLRQDRGN